MAPRGRGMDGGEARSTKLSFEHAFCYSIQAWFIACWTVRGGNMIRILVRQKKQTVAAVP